MSTTLGAVIFAALWTAAMLWWNVPLDSAAVIIWMVAGTIAGLLWFLLMNWALTRMTRQENGG